MVLDKIQRPNDIKKLNEEELDQLRTEIRQFLIESISKTGGHLASNLGVVELTMALHLSFDLPQDKIIWDVGHQSYTHKILTGRREGFASLRQYGGMSGFPKANESACDCFNTGHSSTSVSAGIGLAKAREITGEDYHVISVIGDGALTGGMAYEALNNASSVKGNFIIVLNDNNMSISRSVGGMSRYLEKFRTTKRYQNIKSGVKQSLNNIPVYGNKWVNQIHNTKNTIKQFFIPGMFFEEMGIMYMGPFDGENIRELCTAFNQAKMVSGPVLVHVITKKGSGYLPAEKHPARFHGAEPFVIETGRPKKNKKSLSYSGAFSNIMVELGDKNPHLAAITAAMADGTGLTEFSKRYPDRFYDVGIAEQHAVTFAAGLAKAGVIPVFAVYSSFLQRAYDQILHDVCIQNLHVVFAVDRAGLVGADGETHQGIFDLGYLSCTPNMVVLAPKNEWELYDMITYAVEEYKGPIAVRYPRGSVYKGLEEFRSPIICGKGEIIHRGTSRIALYALGSMVETAVDTIRILKEQMPELDLTLVNARFAVPIDEETIRDLAEDHDLIVTMEENVLSGGMGQKIAAFVEGEQVPVQIMPIALPNAYVEHGNVDILKKDLQMDAGSAAARITERARKLHII